MIREFKKVYKKRGRRSSTECETRLVMTRLINSPGRRLKTQNKRRIGGTMKGPRSMETEVPEIREDKVVEFNQIGAWIEGNLKKEKGPGIGLFRGFQHSTLLTSHNEQRTERS